jgi:hypothetical protein
MIGLGTPLRLLDSRRYRSADPRSPKVDACGHKRRTAPYLLPLKTGEGLIFEIKTGECLGVQS